MMQYLIFGLQLLTLLLTFTGLSLFVYDKTKVNPSFLPIITVSIVTVFIFVAGLLNILVLASTLTTIIGILLFFIYLIKILKKQFSIKSLFCPGLAFFFLLSLYFLILLKGTYYLHYDNFSHWGTIVKEMFCFNSFPDEKTIITFRNYPPGTATFIYYVCRIIGYSESHALMAQSLLISSALSVLFYKVKNKNLLYCLLLTVIAIISLSVLSYDDGSFHIYNLLVDAVLGFLTASAVIIAYYYKDNIKLSFWVNAPLLTLLVLTKDSGKIFYIMVLIFTISLFIKSSKQKDKFNWLNFLKFKLPYLCGLAIIPLFSSTLWKAYVIKAYPHTDFMLNTFAISPEKLLYTINNRTPGFLQALPQKLINEVFNFSTINTKLFIAINVISILAIVLFLITKQNCKLIIKSFFATNIMIVAYIINLYILYAFIMNEYEASTLSAFDRYFSTVIIILVIIQLCSIVHCLCRITINRKAWVSVCLSLAIISTTFINGNNITKLYMQPNEQNSKRYNIQQLCNEACKYIGRNQSILLYIGNNPNMGYCYYLLSYEMLTPNCNVITQTDISSDKDTNINLLSDYDYLFISEDNEEFFKIMQAQGITFEGTKNENIYKIDVSGEKVYIAPVIS